MSSGAERGFSLVEALVALVVLSLVAIASLSALGSALDAAHRSRRQLEAAALAGRQLAEIRLRSAADLAAFQAQGAGGRFAAPHDAHAWQATVARVPGENSLWDVVVRVEWGRGAYALHTRVYRP